MQSIFFDMPAGMLSRRPELQSWLKDQHEETGLSRRQGYDRLLLQAEDDQKLYDLLETITFEESMDWILSEEGKSYRRFLEPEAYTSFQQMAQQRIQKMEPQLRSIIRQDLERLLTDADSFNVGGYLQFSARKLKRLLRHSLREEYNRLENELEQEEFVELLRFFISIQPPLLEEAHLTLYGDRFTLTDEWGNDLREIYLESLSEEELVGVSSNDLMMSILITLLPQTIFVEIRQTPKSEEFLQLLQRVFREQIVWKETEEE